MASNVNKIAEAFKEGGNLIGLTGIVAISAAFLTPLPLIAGLVAEATYLLFVPDSRWYDVRLSRRFDAEVALRRERLKEQIFAQIDEHTQQRFTRLEEIRSQINVQAQKDQKWYLEVLRKLDYLQEKFLLFAGKESEFRTYLVTVWQDEAGSGSGQPPQVQSFGPMRVGGIPLVRKQGGRQQSAASPADVIVSDDRITQMVADVQKSYDDDVIEMQKRLATESDSNTKAVMEKRVEVLQQRREGVGKIGRILTNLRNQLALVEDTFGLINDQIRARSPEQVLSDIEGVVYQTDSMTSMLEELAPFEQMAA